MLAAVSTEGELIYASEVKSKYTSTTEFYCPHCSQRVFFKVSHRGKSFFSHLTKCNHNESRIKPLETEEHLLGKEIILSELQSVDNQYVQSEFFFSQINQHADVFVKTTGHSINTIIFEFQRSIIPAHEVYLRNYNYEQEVDQVHWLIDYHATKKLQINQRWIQTMLNYCADDGFHLKLLDLHSKEIVIQHNLPVIFKKDNIEYKERRVTLEDFQKINRPKNSHSKIIRVSSSKTKEKQYFRQLNSITNSETYRQNIYLLYQHGTILAELPKWVFIDEWQILITKTPSWLVFSWILTLLKQMNGTFNTEEFTEKIRTCTEIQLADTPLIHEDVYSILSMSILVLFMRKGIIEMKSKHIWIVIN